MLPKEATVASIRNAYWVDSPERTGEQIAMKTCLFVLLAAGAVLYGAVGYTAESAGLSWEELCAGMQFERERLIAGVYSASGTGEFVRTDPTDGFELFSAFSFAEEKIRFEHRGRSLMRRAGAQLETDVHRLICLLPDKTYRVDTHRKDLSRMITILHPGVEELRKKAGLRGYLDPRCLGLLRIDQLASGVRFQDALEQFNSLFSRSAISISHAGAGVYRASSTGRGGRMSVWIDTEQGFTLVRRLVENGLVNEETGEFILFSQALEGEELKDLRMRMDERNLDLDYARALDVPEEIQIGWGQVAGVWVPLSYQHVVVAQRENDSKEPGAPPLKVVRSELTMTLNWTAVNSIPSDQMFDYQSFGLPANTPVFDLRDPDHPLVGRVRAEPLAIPDAPRRSIRTWIVLVHVIVIGAVLAIHLWRRRHRWARKTARSGSLP
jgi:hypothetical protein